MIIHAKKIKKVQYKNGIVKVDFFDHNDNLVTIKSEERPHPDFIIAMHNLQDDFKVITNCAIYEEISPIEIQKTPDGKKYTFVGQIFSTDTEEIEIKITMTEKNINENYKALARKIDEVLHETCQFLEGKTAQLSLPFSEQTEDETEDETEEQNDAYLRIAN